MLGYPIVFRTTHVVRTSTYQALVRADGRLLMTEEAGEWACNGVEPGGLAACGSDPTLAYEIFRANLRNAFEDLAEDSPTLDEFRSKLDMLFASDQVEARLWDQALEELRASKAPLNAGFATMNRLAPRESKIELTELPFDATSQASSMPAKPMTAGTARRSGSGKHEVTGASAPLDWKSDDVGLAESKKAA